MIAAIRKTGAGWELRSDDKAERVRHSELFGSDWLPLPFTSEASSDMVMAGVIGAGHYKAVYVQPLGWDCV